MSYSKPYSAHSGTEYQDCDSLQEAISIAQSMCENLGTSYVVDNETHKIVEVYRSQ